MSKASKCSRRSRCVKVAALQNEKLDERVKGNQGKTKTNLVLKPKNENHIGQSAEVIPDNILLVYAPNNFLQADEPLDLTGDTDFWEEDDAPTKKVFHTRVHKTVSLVDNRGRRKFDRQTIRRWSNKSKRDNIDVSQQLTETQQLDNPLSKVKRGEEVPKELFSLIQDIAKQFLHE